MDDHLLTQEATQQILIDETRGSQSDNDAELSRDAICILEPISKAATMVVRQTLLTRPGLVICKDGSRADDIDPVLAPTVDIRGLILRLSYLQTSPTKHFSFGRVPGCDVVLEGSKSCYVSKQHFRIFLTVEGILMLEETSLNGTVVDGVHVKKSSKNGLPVTRMLCDHTRIALMSPSGKLEFLVRMPSRTGHQSAFLENFNRYIAALGRVGGIGQSFPPTPDLRLCTTVSSLPALMPGQTKTDMVWNGGDFYNPLCKIASGAFGTVFKVARKTNGEIVAMKEIYREKFLRHDKWERVKSEITIMEALDHPNIVRLLSHHDIGTHLYMAMDYIPNGTLLDWVMSAPLRDDEAKPLAQQIISSLDYLHSQRITHRDIKPDNILVASRSPVNVKLSDFGLSKALKTDASCLVTFCGTLYYCAPEVHPESDGKHGPKLKRKTAGQGPKSYGSLVDIWSFGVVLWYAMCGSQPFPLDSLKHPTQRAVYEMIVSHKPDPIVLMRYQISDPAIDLLLSMMQVDPSRRPSPVECLNHMWLSNGKHYVSPHASQSSWVMTSLDRIEEELVGDDIFMEITAPESSSGVGIEVAELPLQPVNVNPNLPRAGRKSFLLTEIEKFNRMVSVLDRTATDPSRVATSDAAEPEAQLRDYENVPPAKRQRSAWFQDGEALAESGLFNSLPKFPFLGPPTSAVGSTTGQSPLPTDGANLVFPSSGIFGMDPDGISPLEPEALAQQYAFPSLEDDWFLKLSQSIQQISAAPPEELGNISEPGLNLLSFLLANSTDLYARSLELTSRPNGQMETDGGPVAEICSQAPESIPDYAALFNNPQFILKLSQFLGPKMESFSLSSQLGCLTSTTSSIHNISIPLLGPFTSWGRHPSCTVLYPYPKDTRVSKVSLAIWFLSPAIDGLVGSRATDGASSDKKVVLPSNWSTLPGLHTVINTYARSGIYVNNVHLPPHDSDGNVLYGKLYSGDKITIFCKGEGQLIFECQFSVGDAAAPRPESENPFLIQTSTSKLPEMIYVPPKKVALPVAF